MSRCRTRFIVGSDDVGVKPMGNDPWQQFVDAIDGMPGDASDEQSRYIEATIAGFRIASLYLPNGNPVDTEKYPYKL